MSRRILYDPVQFVEASTPFYENIIGTITDQTDRISRNIELAREDKRLEDDRLWQKSMLEFQIDARRQDQETQMEFQGDQNAMNRDLQFRQHHDNLQLGWAKLGMQQLKSQMDANNRERNDRQVNIDRIHNIKGKAGFLGGDAPMRLHVAQDLNSGRYGIYNTEVEGDPRFVDEYDDYVLANQKLVNFAERFVGGKNIVRWVQDNLQMDADTYQDAEDGARLISGNDMINAVSEIRSGMDVEKNLKLLTDIMDDDSNVRLLFNEDPDKNIRDHMFVTEKVLTSTRNLLNANNYSALIEHDDPNKPSRFIREIRDNPNRYIVQPFTSPLLNMTEQEYEGQSIGQMYQVYQNYRQLGETAGSRGITDDIENVRTGIKSIEQLAEEFIMNNEEFIPDYLRHTPRYQLIASLRLNKEQFLSPRPNLRELFIFPDNEQQMEVLSNSNRDIKMHHERRDTFMTDQLKKGNWQPFRYSPYLGN